MTLKPISKDIAFDTERCKLCDLCVEVCPVKCLENKGDRIVDNGGCVRCKQCEWVCPDFAIYVIKDKKASKG